MAREFKKKWDTAHDKLTYITALGGGYIAHGVNDENTSHYTKGETYSSTEIDDIHVTISGLIDAKEDFVASGLTSEYYRGDKTWQDFDAAVGNAFTASIPIVLTGSDFSLNHNTNNLKITSNDLNTIQDITTTSEPTFNQLNLNNAASASNDAVRADRTITIAGSAPITSSAGAQNLQGNRTWTLSVTASDILGTTNQVSVANGGSTILGSNDVTLSLPQDIAITSNVRFNDVRIDGLIDQNENGINTFSGRFVNISTGANEFSGIFKNTATGINEFSGNIKFNNNKALYHSSFASGWAGAGWKIDQGSVSSLELDDLWVRGTMNVYELIINQIRATNGSLIVSSAAKVASTSINGNDINITFEDPGTHNVVPFLVGDILLMQRVRLDTTTVIKKIAVEVISVTNMICSCDYLFQSSGPATPSPGDDFVRIGSTSNTNRQGVVYLTSDDSGSPFIDIIDGVTSYADWGDSTKNKARLGKLNGIVTNAGQALDNYGLYTNRLYAEGQVEVRGELSVGDDTTFGNSFYAGRINKNILLKSQDADWGDSDSPIYHWESGTSDRTNISATLPDGTTADIYAIREITEAVYTIIGTETARSTHGDMRNNTYTFSFWARGPHADVQGTYNATLEFPTDTTISSPSFVVTNDWQRFTFTVTCPNTGDANSTLRLLFPNKISATYHLYLWGIQVEKTAYTTMYQPTDGTLSTETDFGMWASKGGFGGTMQNPRVNIIDNGIIIRKDDSSSRTWVGSDTISMGYNPSNSDWGIIGKEGNTKIFELGSTNKIAGWTFTDDSFSKDNTKLMAGFGFEGLVVDDGSGNDVIRVGDFVNQSESYFSTVLDSNWGTWARTGAGGNFTISIGSDPGSVDPTNTSAATNGLFIDEGDAKIYRTISSSYAGETVTFKFDLEQREHDVSFEIPVNTYPFIKLTSQGHSRNLGMILCAPTPIAFGAGTSYTNYEITITVPDDATDIRFELDFQGKNTLGFAGQYNKITIANFQIIQYDTPFVELNTKGLKIFKSPAQRVVLNDTLTSIESPLVKIGHSLQIGDWTLESVLGYAIGASRVGTLVFRFQGEFVASLNSNTKAWDTTDRTI